MTDQRRRAADFDRRMRWSWMRKGLADTDPADGSPAEVVVDLRPSEEHAAPRRRD